MSPNSYLLVGLAVVIGALSAAFTYALLRLVEAARGRGRRRGTEEREAALLSVALEEAIAKLKAQERATAARADASERLSDEIISSLSAGLLVVGLDGAVRIVNPAARRMLRLAEPLPEGHYRELLGDPALSSVIDECLATASPIFRRPVQRSDGSGRHLHLGVTVSPLTDETGANQGAVCLFTDLTSVRQLEEQLRLKESLAAVGELTAGIAHEFRYGLATIHGYGKLIDPAGLPPNYRPYVEGIRAEAESLSQVVTNFLNFARPAELTLSRIELRSICERAADEVRSEARALGGDITIAGEFGALDGDEVLLRQAMSNLLRNAVEACAGVSVAPRVDVRSDIDVARNTTRVIVDDNGPGIKPDAREHVFRPFFTQKRGGTGLGLALVQKIIVFHNGRIVVADSPLGGARLQITLPISR
jgi:two-component system sensor histidine kinase HydH